MVSVSWSLWILGKIRWNLPSDNDYGLLYLCHVWENREMVSLSTRP